jgi:ribosome biogenesis GTPase
MRELQLWDTGEAVAGAFADVEAIAEECRFRDCRTPASPAAPCSPPSPPACCPRRGWRASGSCRRAGPPARQQDERGRIETKRRPDRREGDSQVLREKDKEPRTLRAERRRAEASVSRHRYARHRSTRLQRVRPSCN